ncbi:unnamed protein product [Microthlaspi erraticum]|uniref:Uncharacterized protein n=1 Tax=Microthlaspi erraticum TaxID=1685480 RepID=A0A6D2KKZ6_9BRAS|nr:unnamed protein product [Microthlaspi erraticum]
MSFRSEDEDNQTHRKSQDPKNRAGNQNPRNLRRNSRKGRNLSIQKHHRLRETDAHGGGRGGRRNLWKRLQWRQGIEEGKTKNQKLSERH